MAIRIIIEGIEDKKFLKDYLSYLGYKGEGIEFVLLETDIESKHKSNLKNKIERLTDAFKQSDGQEIVIIDADNNREKYIAVAKKYNISDEKIFTFPDNEGSGNLENLIEKICKNEKFFECFQKYQKCLGDNELKTIDNKGKIYSYDHSTGGKGKGIEREYTNPKQYDLNSPSLEPLKIFLETHLK